MSKNLSNLAVKQFEAEVHHEFTAVASTAYTELARTRFIKAQKTQFPVFGYSAMRPHVKGVMIPPANGARTPVEVTLSRYAISDTTDIFDDAEVNFSERQEFVKSMAKSFKNQGLQVLIDALAAGTPTDTVANNISGAADNLTVAAVRKAAELLDANGVPNDGKRVLLVPSSAMHALTREPEVTSSDFVNKQVYNTGMLPDFYGFKIISIGSMIEGGLPTNGNDTICMAYHTDALGLAIGVNQQVTIDWENMYGMWSVSGFLSAGAALIDGKGFVKVAAKTS
jgi:hypothetical protein